MPDAICSQSHSSSARLASSSTKSLLSHVIRNTHFLIFVLLLSLCGVSFGNVVMGEQCDWTGSGLEMSGGKWMGETRRITPIYLRCSQGRVSWVYPRGGLRVLLRYGSSGKDFKGCIKVNPTFSGARIFHENQKTLTELYSPTDNLPFKLARCFHSYNGQAALYVEAASPSSHSTVFPKYLAEFSYDLEAIQKNSYDPLNRCRPCDKEELLRAFCTKDLVISGSIERIHRNEALDDLEIIVQVDKYLKYSAFDVIDYPSSSKTRESNEVETDEMGTQFGNRSVSVTIPKICESKPSAGRFVFMVRKRFDEYALVCAPRWEDWKLLAWHENQNGNAQCVLSF